MSADRLADDILQTGSHEKNVDVQVSYEVVKLFSEQLYASPVKAVEELVVNSWDAGAEVCSVIVDLDGQRPLIAVFDSGKGMTLAELENLWHIGVSEKPKVTSGRKQIGKFGIGKLASYAVARHATYISRTTEGIFAVSINFERFAEATDATGTAKPVTLEIRRIDDLSTLSSSTAFTAAQSVLATNGHIIDLNATSTWTLVVLEDLKEKASQLATGRLRWVLETAMPLSPDFALYLNGERVASSKEGYERVVQFNVRDLEDSRLSDLSAVTGETWSRTADGVVSASFPSGVTGEVFVTNKSLYAAGGKSEDLGRSHGFFVRVHNRLVNETDPLFGARPLSFSTWYHFAAIVEADDLNRYVTAARDDVEQSAVKAKLRELLIQLFNQARDSNEARAKAAAAKNREQKEGKRDYVPPELVERPLADALVGSAAADEAAEELGEWRLLEPVTDLDELQALVDHLYTSERSDRAYTFRYSPSGPLSPLARLDPRSSTFTINEDHELVREFSENPASRRLLEAVIVAESLLEVYLRVADVPREAIDELLDRRDSLLRSLALDQSYSLASLAGALRDAKDRANDLEVALVGALRSLGFSARHIGGSGTPDGKAEYAMHGTDDVSFTLEAKSSGDVPSLGHLDFAGLRSHYEATGAQGCLLVAPTYPGIDDPASEVSNRARQQKVSCWTIDQLAEVVLAAERRHINAYRLQEIVLNAFAPTDVGPAVAQLLAEPTYDNVDLYRAILAALRSLEPRLRGTPRNLFLLAAEISREDAFATVDTPEIRKALLDLARSSRGMLHISEDDEVFVLGALDELERRTSTLTGSDTAPRRRGTFRGRLTADDDASGGES